MSATQRVQQWATFARTWHVFDCAWQNPYHSAPVLKKYLLGYHKPIFNPMTDCGDHVVAINTKQIALPGDEWKKRAYFHHTGYAGGATWTLAWQLHEKDSTMIMKKAVYNSIRGNLQRRYVMQRLHLIPDDKIPDEILERISNQIRPIRPVPKRLDHIDQAEIDAFPQIMQYPEEYVMK